MISYGLDLILMGQKNQKTQPNWGDLISPSWFCSGRNDSQIIHLAGLCRVPEHVAGPEIMLATFFFLLLTRRYSESGSWSVMGGPVVPHWYLDHWDPCLQSTVREVADGLLNNPLVDAEWLRAWRNRRLRIAGGQWEMWVAVQCEVRKVGKKDGFNMFYCNMFYCNVF